MYDVYFMVSTVKQPRVALGSFATQAICMHEVIGYYYCTLLYVFRVYILHTRQVYGDGVMAVVEKHVQTLATVGETTYGRSERRPLQV